MCGVRGWRSCFRTRGIWWRIGRREDCDIRIPLGEVSRKHCRLIMQGDALRLEDLGSSNGTFLNGQRVQESVVQPGDRLQIGPVAFTVQINGVPADDEIQPAAPPRPTDETQTGSTSPAGAAGESAIEDFLLNDDDKQNPDDAGLNLDLEELEDPGPKNP
ncbi:MAG TPA: FHA domain-containing protein [Tepidisphaeraceae bacterium]|nr:FHA domain-containing protein [Tepidisphaeraceae bacterium]